MRKWKQTLAAIVLGGALAQPGGAQNLSLNEMASVLVLPIVTGGHELQTPLEISHSGVTVNANDAVTLATITNGKSSPVLLKIDLVNGDPGAGSWNSTSFECELTGRETTTFVFQGDDSNSSLDGITSLAVECSDGTDTEGDDKALLAGFDNGFMVVAVADPQTGQTMSQDAIFGDAIVLDATQGLAYSFGAIPFQAGFGQNDGDKVYRFDGNEYQRFPAVLATNFLLPTQEITGSIEAELILFTLDGTAGTTRAPRAKLGGYAYNDDEEAIDFQYEFDCFDIVGLEEVNRNIQNDTTGGPGLNTLSGHLELVAQPTATGNDAHDDQYGDGNDTRTRAVHGWIAQALLTEGTLVPAGQPIPGAPEIALPFVTGLRNSAAWGRPLSQSRNPVVPFLGDWDTTLDLDVRN